MSTDAQNLTALGRLISEVQSANRWSYADIASNATAAGMGVGTALAAIAVGTAPELPDLAAFGAVAGAVTGLAQALAVTREPVRVAGWAAVVSAAWAVAWTVTTSIGVDVERGYVVFGSSGAVVATLLTGLALPILAAAAPATVKADVEAAA